MKTTLFCSLLVCLLTMIGCSKSPTMAGGGSGTGTGNAFTRIAGSVRYSDNTAAVNADVYLRPKNFLSDTSITSHTGNTSSTLSTKVDASGMFTLDSVDIGRYSIEINNQNSKVALVECNVDSINKTFSLPPITLDSAGTVTGVIDGSGLSDSVTAYILVYGLDRAVKADINGAFTLPDMPEGTFDIKVVFSEKEYVPRDSVKAEVVSGESRPVDTISVLPQADSSSMDVSVLFIDSSFNEPTLRNTLRILLVRMPDTLQWSNITGPQTTTPNQLLNTFSPYPKMQTYATYAAIEQVNGYQTRVTWDNLDIQSLVAGSYVLAVFTDDGISQAFSKIINISDNQNKVALGITNPCAIRIK